MDEHVRPHPDRAALLTIDTQRDFTLPGAPAEIDGTMAAVPRMERLVGAFRAADRPVVHVVRLYRVDGSNVDRCRRGELADGEAVVRPSTPGAELVDALKPSPEVSLDADRLLDGQFQSIGPREWVVYKPRWGAFYDTDLAAFLAERDYRIVFVDDATSGTYDRGMREPEGIGVAVRDTEATVDWVG
jgi:nicotinamidase-related amidase